MVLFNTPRFQLDTAVDPSPPPLQAAGKGLIPYSEVNKHDNEGDCWVVINGKVYDLTEVSLFLRLQISGSTVKCHGRVEEREEGEERERGKEGRRGRRVLADISSPVKLTLEVPHQFTEQQEKTHQGYSTPSIHLVPSKMV